MGFRPPPTHNHRVPSRPGTLPCAPAPWSPWSSASARASPCSPGSTPGKAPEDPPNPPVRKGPARRRRGSCPGLLADGSVQLPNQWKLRPAGRQIEVGNFPVNLAVHPSGQYLAVLHAGWQDHEVMILDLNKAKQKIVSRVSVDQTFYGLCFSPDGRRLYASGGEFEVVHEFDFQPRAARATTGPISLAGAGERLVVGGLAMDAAGRDLFACCTWGDIVVRVPVENPENRTVIHVGKAKPAAKGGRAKGEPASPPDGRKDPKDGDPRDKEKASTGPGRRASTPTPACPTRTASAFRQPVEQGRRRRHRPGEERRSSSHLADRAHPTEMALSPDGKTLFVACANSTQVSVLDTEDGKALQTINCALYPTAPTGNTPNSLCLTPDGQMLFVANADANNLAVFNVAEPGKAKPLGLHPGRLVSDLRPLQPGRQAALRRQRQGASRRKPNRARARTRSGRATRPTASTSAGLFRGTLGIIDMPTPAAHGELHASRRTRAARCARTGPSRPTASGGQPDPAQGRRPEPDQALHLRHQGEPHLRPGLRRHARRATATRTCACSPRR